MVYTLGKAAKATGKSKATISKAIKSGKISAKKDETGIYQIDPSELHRVYPLTTLDTGNLEQQDTPIVNTENTGKIRELELILDATKQRLEDRDKQLSDIKEDRDKWRQQATGLLEDKKARRFWSRLFN